MAELKNSKCQYQFSLNFFLGGERGMWHLLGFVWSTVELRFALHRQACFVVGSIANLGCSSFNSTAESHKQELLAP
jgi:hypothetical protein